MRFQLRALTLGELFDEAWLLFRGALLPLIVFQLFIFVPTALVEVLAIRLVGDLVTEVMSAGAELWMPVVVVLVGFGVVIAIQVIVGPVVGVAMTRAVADTYLARRWTVRTLLGVALRFTPRAIAAGLIVFALFVLIALVPTVLALGATISAWVELDAMERILWVVVMVLVAGVPVVVGAAYVNLRFVLSFAALAVEDVSALRSLARAGELMRGRYWSALALFTVLMLVGLLFGAASSMLVPSPSFETLDPDQIRLLLPKLVDAQILSTLLAEAMGMFTRTYMIICWTLFYLSARCASEGFDLELLAERLGQGAHATPAR